MTEPIWAGCTGKEPFERAGVARAVARRMSQRGKHVSAYRCDFCPNWHVGTPPKGPKFGKNGQRLKPVDPRHRRPAPERE